MKGVLDGIKVVEFTVGQQGPFAGVMLGDLGADIIKIEDRVRGDFGRGYNRIFGKDVPFLAGGRNFYFEGHNRNKRSITLDLKKEKGREIAYKLVEKADVFMHNQRPGATKKLGIDYETLSRINPRIIYANANTFGLLGPDSHRPGMDMSVQGRSGLMDAIGETGMPPLPASAGMCDQVGAMMLAFGVLAALIGRERLGISQEIHTSLLGSTLNLIGLQATFRSLNGWEHPKPCRTKAMPLWNYYRCSDNRWLCLSGRTMAGPFWAEFCRTMGVEELSSDPRFIDNAKMDENAAELISILDKVFATKTQAEWLKILGTSKDILYGPVNSMSDVLQDPQILLNQYMVEYDHPVLGKVKLLGPPVTFTKTTAGPRLPAPEHGQHTEEILLEMGYDWDQIAQIKAGEVI